METIGSYIETKIRAIWHVKIVASSDNTVIVEGNHYFPPILLNNQLFLKSEILASCARISEAIHDDVNFEVALNQHPAWYYLNLKTLGLNIDGYLTF